MQNMTFLSPAVQKSIHNNISLIPTYIIHTMIFDFYLVWNVQNPDISFDFYGIGTRLGAHGPRPVWWSITVFLGYITRTLQTNKVSLNLNIHSTFSLHVIKEDQKDVVGQSTDLIAWPIRFKHLFRVHIYIICLSYSECTCY